MRRGAVVFTLILLLAVPGTVFAQRSPLLFGQQPRSRQGGDTASWQQWDAFLTFDITRLGQALPREGRDRLAELLLNARYELVDALISPTVRLEHDIRYNGRAGSEILLNYLTGYAIRRGEHRRPGGIDNLARATYGAYNGGPRHLTRYRKATTNPHLKRVDDMFWTKYAQVKSGNELEVRQCYGF